MGLGRGSGWPGSGAARRGWGRWQSAGAGAALAWREASRPHTAGRRGNSWDSSRGAALPLPRRGHPQEGSGARASAPQARSRQCPGESSPNPTISALATPGQRRCAQRHRVFCSCRLPRPARPPACWSLARAVRIDSAPGKASACTVVPHPCRSCTGPDLLSSTPSPKAEGLEHASDSGLLEVPALAFEKLWPVM